VYATATASSFVPFVRVAKDFPTAVPNYTQGSSLRFSLDMETTTPPGAVLDGQRLESLRRSERAMVMVRWAGAAFAVVQVLAYRELPYPPGVKAAALGLAGLLAVANVAIWVASRRMETVRGARALAMVGLTVDILAASGFVWLYAFDPGSALWAVLLILPLEGAIRFGLAGALASWAAVTVLYAGREVFRVRVYPETTTGPGGFGFQPESVSFRMGIGLLIAMVAGLMARNLIRQRTQVSEALAELSRIDTLRSRLVATLAHDVRGPLTTIRGTFKTLARHHDKLDRETQDELLRTADRQAARMERLAANLLDLARLEEGRLELAMQDVSLAEAVKRGLMFADQDHRFDVNIDPALTVRADPARLEQVIVNLTANALRYGEPPFTIEARSVDGRVEVAFRDQGPGVAPADRQALFEPFRTERDRGSVGLGLAIVRALAEAQGGRVTYEPNAPRGACFRLTLASSSS
jgi:signal transduction histidine kinase